MLFAVEKRRECPAQPSVSSFWSSVARPIRRWRQIAFVGLGEEGRQDNYSETSDLPLIALQFVLTA